jgi:hypothetical protein
MILAMFLDLGQKRELVCGKSFPESCTLIRKEVNSSLIAK